MKCKRIAVIGHQRNGTTVFRQFIGSSDRSFDLGEIFHQQTDLSTNFWGFLHARASEIPAYRHPAHWRLVWAEFIAHQSRSFPADLHVFDLKIEYFPYVLRKSGTRSAFFFQDPDLLYVLLRRRNTAAQIISRHVAIATNKWVELDPDADAEAARRLNQVRGTLPAPVPISGLTIDPARLLDEIEALHREDEALLPLLQELVSAQFWYEELFDPDGMFREDVVEKIADLTGIPPDRFDRRPATLRQSTDDFLSVVTNRAELVEAFAGSGHEWMLKGADA